MYNIMLLTALQKNLNKKTNVKIMDMMVKITEGERELRLREE